MPFKNKQTLCDWNKRKNDRQANYGIQNEKDIEALLRNEKKDEEKVFVEVIHHEQNSLADRKGKDFTVSIVRGGQTVSRSFGVTISKDSHKLSSARHPDVTCIFTPIGFNRDKFIRKVLALFDK